MLLLSSIAFRLIFVAQSYNSSKDGLFNFLDKESIYFYQTF